MPERDRPAVPRRRRARQNGFLSERALLDIGFARVGENVQIDDGARFYGADRISLGSNVRIDGFAVLSAGPDGIAIGDYVHLAVGALISGAARIELHDFANISSRVAIYSSNDDYHGYSLTNPTVPDRFRKVHTAPVVIGKHVIVGSGALILPGVTIGIGAAVGALTIVKHDVAPFTIVAGPSGRVIGKRRDDLLALEAELRSGGHSPARPTPL
jgi:dTDP-4-amino-4,6-dideoxy-D-glucose acyltransferase